jgi:hypothetical protein
MILMAAALAFLELLPRLKKVLGLDDTGEEVVIATHPFS